MVKSAETLTLPPRKSTLTAPKVATVSVARTQLATLAISAMLALLPQLQLMPRTVSFAHKDTIAQPVPLFLVEVFLHLWTNLSAQLVITTLTMVLLTLVSAKLAVPVKFALQPLLSTPTPILAQLASIVTLTVTRLKLSPATTLLRVSLPDSCASQVLTRMELNQMLASLALLVTTALRTTLVLPSAP